jgi:hypothetical protein
VDDSVHGRPRAGCFGSRHGTPHRHQGVQSREHSPSATHSRGLPRAGPTSVGLEASNHSRVGARADSTLVGSRRVAPACRALGLRRRRDTDLREGGASGRGTAWRDWLHRPFLLHLGSHLLRPSRVGRGRLRSEEGGLVSSHPSRPRATARLGTQDSRERQGWWSPPTNQTAPLRWPASGTHTRRARVFGLTAAGEGAVKASSARWTGFGRTVDHPVEGSGLARSTRRNMVREPTMPRERSDLEGLPSLLGTVPTGRCQPNHPKRGESQDRLQDATSLQRPGGESRRSREERQGRTAPRQWHALVEGLEELRVRSDAGPGEDTWSVCRWRDGL